MWYLDWLREPLTQDEPQYSHHPPWGSKVRMPHSAACLHRWNQLMVCCPRRLVLRQQHLRSRSSMKKPSLSYSFSPCQTSVETHV